MLSKNWLNWSKEPEVQYLEFADRKRNWNRIGFTTEENKVISTVSCIYLESLK